MNELPHFLKRCLPKVATACLLSPLLLLTSCSSTKNQNTAGAPGEYPSDGSYHPYTQPAGGGAGSSSHYKEYSPSDSSNSPGYQPQSPDSHSYADNGSDNPPPKKKKKKKKTTDADSDYVASSNSSSHKSSSTTHKSTSSSSSGNYRNYVIKHGDTYYSLAKKYHTSVATLKRINGRSSDTLRDGEKIKIPPRKADV